MRELRSSITRFGPGGMSGIGSLTGRNLDG